MVGVLGECIGLKESMTGFQSWMHGLLSPHSKLCYGVFIHIMQGNQNSCFPLRAAKTVPGTGGSTSLHTNRHWPSLSPASFLPVIAGFAVLAQILCQIPASVAYSNSVLTLPSSNTHPWLCLPISFCLFTPFIISHSEICEDLKSSGSCTVTQRGPVIRQNPHGNPEVRGCGK